MIVGYNAIEVRSGLSCITVSAITAVYVLYTTPPSFRSNCNMLEMYDLVDISNECIRISGKRVYSVLLVRSSIGPVTPNTYQDA